jgi:FkbM family methyltransferase
MKETSKTKIKNKKLVFDLGFHNGDDTDYYLSKGFRVIAVEANPDLVAEGKVRFEKYISAKKLVLLNMAISDVKEKVSFYIHPTKPDWSSCNKKLAEIDGSKSRKIVVDTVSFRGLCRQFGTPFYVKVDIEGSDILVAKELYSLKQKPEYISFETSKQTYMAVFSWLYVSGYKKFQLVNQQNNPIRCGDYKFTKYSSGFFGNYLSKDRWLDFNEALSRYMKYKELKVIDNQELALGWLDIHAKL